MAPKKKSKEEVEAERLRIEEEAAQAEAGASCYPAETSDLMCWPLSVAPFGDMMAVRSMEALITPISRILDCRETAPGC